MYFLTQLRVVAISHYCKHRTRIILQQFREDLDRKGLVFLKADTANLADEQLRIANSEFVTFNRARLGIEREPIYIYGVVNDMDLFRINDLIAE